MDGSCLIFSDYALSEVSQNDENARFVRKQAGSCFCNSRGAQNASAFSCGRRGQNIAEKYGQSIKFNDMNFGL